jgi:hypothetical protein
MEWNGLRIAMCYMCDGFAKSVTEKTSEGMVRGIQQKDHASPERNKQ